MARIPFKDIVLLLMLKVFPPWADTWSDVMWINKLVQFGQEYTQFDVTTYQDFLLATEDCTDAHWLNEGSGSGDEGSGDEGSGSGDEGSGSGDEVIGSEFEVSGGAMSHEPLVPVNSKALLNAVVNFLSPFYTRFQTTVRCKKDYSQWAIASALPLVGCIGFTLLLWGREEKGWSKALLLPVVLAGLYSQFRAVKIIFIGLGVWPNRRQEDWKKEKARFKHEVIAIEPTTEALPTMLIQVALLSVELTALIFGQRPSPLVDNLKLFQFTFCLTIVLTVMGLANFPKDGPSPLISSEGCLDGYLTIQFATLFSSILLWFVAKCLLLAGIVHFSAASGLDLAEVEQDIGNTLAGNFSFSEEVVSNLGYKSIVGVELGQGVLTGIMFWASTQILPHLVYSATLLAMSTRSNVVGLSLSFPAFLITPLFTPFTYKGSSIKGKYEFQVSIRHSIINLASTILLTPFSMIFFYVDFIWKSTYSFGLTTDQISKYQSNINLNNETSQTQARDLLQTKLDIHMQYTQIMVLMFVILPCILMILVTIPTLLLLSNSCSCNKEGKYKNKTKFKTVGKMRWEVIYEETDYIMEMVDIKGVDLNEEIDQQSMEAGKHFKIENETAPDIKEDGDRDEEAEKSVDVNDEKESEVKGENKKK